MAKIIEVDVTDFHWTTPGHVPVTSPKVSSNYGVHQGKMVGFKAVASNAVNGITYTVAIKDRDGDIIYTSGANAENATTVTMGLDVPIVEQETVTIDPSADPGDTPATTVDFAITKLYLYYHPDPDNAL